MDRVLIQSCSMRKIPGQGFLPAVERYDGSAFLVIKKYLREKSLVLSGGRIKGKLKLFIISAEFGLLEPHTEIPDYDRRMNCARARELAPRIAESWTSVSKKLIISEIFINLSRDYLPTISLIEFKSPVIFAKGGIGRKNGQLKNWLRREM